MLDSGRANHHLGEDFWSLVPSIVAKQIEGVRIHVASWEKSQDRRTSFFPKNKGVGDSIIVRFWLHSGKLT